MPNADTDHGDVAGYGVIPGRQNMASILEKRRKELDKQQEGLSILRGMTGMPGSDGGPPLPPKDEPPPAAPAAPAVPPPPVIDQAPASPPVEPATPPASDPQPPAPPVQDAPPPQEKTYDIVVNGVRRTLTEAQLVQQAQLGVASQERFQEAARLREQARQERETTERIAQLLNPNATQAPTRTGEPQPAAPVSSPSVPALDADRLAKMVQFGNEDEAKQAFDTLIQYVAQGRTPAPAAAPTLDVNAISEQAAQQAYQRLSSEQALAAFASEYSDVLNDPHLVHIAAQYANQIRTHDQSVGAPQPDLVVYRQAGERTRAWRDSLIKPAAQTAAEQASAKALAEAAARTTQQATDRLANIADRKAAAPQPPTPATARADAVSPARPRTGNEYIAQLQANLAARQRSNTGRMPAPISS